MRQRNIVDIPGMFQFLVAEDARVSGVAVIMESLVNLLYSVVLVP